MTQNNSVDNYLDKIGQDSCRKKSVNDYLDQINQESNLPQERDDNNIDKSLNNFNDLKNAKTTIKTRLQIKRTKSKAALKAAEKVSKAQVEYLEDQIDQSRVHWKAEKANTIETIKNEIQEVLSDIEVKRSANRNDALIKAAALAHKRMDEINSSDLSENLKFELFRDLKEDLDKTKLRIKNDVLAKKYDLL